MSNFVLGVGGTGAKFVQTLIHLSAAGLIPGDLDCLLVDPDENNGNVDECQRLAKSYADCKKLNTGNTDLFNRRLTVTGPWSPIADPEVDTLNEIFHYNQMKVSSPTDADLMELLFTPLERQMQIKQGFRGRPAIGAAVLGNSVSFADEEDVWFKLEKMVRGNQGQGEVHVLLAGSVFGGSGAAGVPTIFRLLRDALGGVVPNLRLGLVLFLPYFQFAQIPGEEVQADPHAFAVATAEALKYYEERGFLDMCNSIYAVGEQVPADMAVSSVGAATQRNEAHFLELVAGLGAAQFLSDKESRSADHTLAIAAREFDNTLRWQDLPTAAGQQELQLRKLQQMTLFALAFHYCFYPVILREQGKTRTTVTWLKDHVIDQGLTWPQVMPDFAAVDEYVTRYLTWLLRISTPRRDGFHYGMVNPNVFAVQTGPDWKLKTTGEFRDKDVQNLFVNLAGRAKADFGVISRKAADKRTADLDRANGSGRLVRAIYDSCELS